MSSSRLLHYILIPRRRVKALLVDQFWFGRSRVRNPGKPRGTVDAATERNNGIITEVDMGRHLRQSDAAFDAARISFVGMRSSPITVRATRKVLWPRKEDFAHVLAISPLDSHAAKFEGCACVTPDCGSETNFGRVAWKRLVKTPPPKEPTYARAIIH